jgi:hypothetical protein
MQQLTAIIIILIINYCNAHIYQYPVETTQALDICPFLDSLFLPNINIVEQISSSTSFTEINCGGRRQSWFTPTNIERVAAIIPTSLNWNLQAKGTPHPDEDPNVSSFRLHSIASISDGSALFLDVSAICRSSGEIHWIFGTNVRNISSPESIDFGLVIDKRNAGMVGKNWEIPPQGLSGKINRDILESIPFEPNVNVKWTLHVAICRRHYSASNNNINTITPSPSTITTITTTPTTANSTTIPTSSTTTTTKYKRTTVFSIIPGSITELYSWGTLTPIAYWEFVFVSLLLIPKTIMVIWFTRLCLVFSRWGGNHLLKQQIYFLGAIYASLFVTLLWVIDFGEANGNSGRTVCCDTPVPGSYVFMQALQWCSNQSFNLLLLATAKGWSVVRRKLPYSDTRKIGFWFLFIVCIFVARRILEPSLGLEWLVVASNSGIWIWIWVSLRWTIEELQDSINIEASTRAIKLKMYLSLHRLVLVSFWVFLLMLAIILLLASSDDRGVRLFIYHLPYSSPWEISSLILVWGFGWIWRPSPATALVALTFDRESVLEEDEETNPISSFGVEMSG